MLPELDETLWPARGQVLATAPLEERFLECTHIARHGFDYRQQLQDGRIVLGGFRDFSILTEMTNEDVWVAAGSSGHGHVLGLMCGELVASAMLGGDDPLLELFSPARLLPLEAS